MAELRVAARFCGPPGVANGGFASGSLAALLGGATEVTLRRPLPLDRPLPVRGDGHGTLVVEDGGRLLAEARPAKAPVELLAVPGTAAPLRAVPAAVTPEAAEAAAGRSRYYDAPVFPGCFVCGPARTAGDGLRVFPGRVAGRALWAAPWTPDTTVAGADGRVRPEVVWAALDCPSGIAAADAADLPADTAVVLGRMAATVGGLPRPGDRCRVVAWPLAGDGRKLGAGSALLGPDGEVLAAARTVWITVARRGGVMTARRRGVALTPMETRHDVIVRAAQLADELGYEAFAVPEGWGLDSTLLQTELALRTRRITLVSAILSVWGRTPATLAMTAATLYRLAQGRYVLGLGTSTRALVEGFHDVAFERPADKLREVTAKVRALLAGERAQLDTAAVARPLRLGLPPVPELPIWLAAMGERTTRVAAELGDGWIPMFLSPDRLAGRAAELGQDRRAACLRSGPLTVAAGPWTVADADPGAARQVVAGCVAWYLSAMGDVYGRTVAGQGYGAAVEAIKAANPRPRPQGGTVPAEARVVLDEFTAHGTPSQVREQLERWDSVADVTLVALPPGIAWEAIEATLRAAAP